MISYFLAWYMPAYPALPVNYKDSTSFQPAKRYYVEFPAYLDKLCYPIDQPFLSLIQSTTSPLIVFFAQIFSMIFSTNTLVCFPMFFLLIGKYDLVSICIAIIGIYLCFSWQMKRFIWRYRPYMVNRGKLILPLGSSSFPNQLCTNVIVFLFITVLTLDWIFIPRVETYDPYKLVISTESYLFSPLLIIFALITVVLAAFFSVYCSLSYASDCVVGIANGLFICLIGKISHGFLLLFCSIDIYVIDSFDVLSPIDIILIIGTFIFGCTLVGMLMSYPILLSHRVAVLMGVYYPAMLFSFLYLCSDRIYLVDRNYKDNNPEVLDNTIYEKIIYSLLSILFLHLLVKIPKLRDSDGLGKKMLHFILSFWGCFILTSLVRLKV